MQQAVRDAIDKVGNLEILRNGEGKLDAKAIKDLSDAQVATTTAAAAAAVAAAATIIPPPPHFHHHHPRLTS